MLAKDLFNIDKPTREQVYSALFRPVGWESHWYSGLGVLDFGIKDNERVLDIGGGNKPYPRANVVVEKFISDSSQRGDKPVSLYENQELVCASIDSLPFSDKSFDFIYTSHTLEHADDFMEAIKEISRVGKRGYCALPLGSMSPFTDEVEQGHKWLASFDYDRYVLCVRKKLESWELCDDFAKFHVFLHTKNVAIGKNELPYTYYFEQKYRYIWELRFVWKDSIKCELIT